MTDKRPRHETLIMGRNCIEEVLRYFPEKLLKVFIGGESEKGRKDELISAIIEHKIPYEYVSKHALFSMVESTSHQGFVAKIKKRELLDLKEYIESCDSERGFLLMLDSIYDPQNLGALLRAAECFGVDGVIYSKNRGSDITPVVAKASNGASELVPLICVSNLADSLTKLQKEGFEVVTAEMEGGHDLSGFVFPKKTVLVMGSEGEGVQPMIRKMADHRVYISMFGKITSLNVSQATSIFLYRWKNADL